MVENGTDEAPLSYRVNIVTALNKVSICKGVKCQIDFFNIILKGYKLIIYIKSFLLILESTLWILYKQ